MMKIRNERLRKVNGGKWGKGWGEGTSAYMMTRSGRVFAPARTVNVNNERDKPPVSSA